MTTQAAGTPRAVEFFGGLLDAWQRAAAEAGAVETRRYRLGELALEVRLAGGGLVEPLTAALAHLPEPLDGAETLVVHGWETETTGVVAPPAPWGADDYREYGTIRGFFDERFQSVFQWGSHSLVMLDVERGRAVYWVRDAGGIPFFERAAPLRLALHGWLASRGVELVHAAAVGDERGCALLVGKAGSGKSWTTLAASASGLRIVSDDYCLVTPGSPPRVSSVYSAAKTHDDAFDRLAFLGPMVGNPERPADDKAVYFLQQHAPERLLLGGELRAVLLPRHTRAGAPALSPASAADALGALAPSTILQLPAAGAATLARLAGIVRTVPAYVFETGSELGEIGPAIATILEP